MGHLRDVSYEPPAGVCRVCGCDEPALERQLRLCRGCERSYRRACQARERAADAKVDPGLARVLPAGLVGELGAHLAARPDGQRLAAFNDWLSELHERGLRSREGPR